MIDWLLLNVQPVVLAIFRTRTQVQQHMQTVQKWGEVIGQHGQSISIASEKVWGVEQGQTI